VFAGSYRHGCRVFAGCRAVVCRWQRAVRACHIAVLDMKRHRRLTTLGEVCRAEECTDEVVDCPPPSPLPPRCGLQ
jgi:hypothetical protein